MLIRMFVKSHSSDESKKICERILIKLEKYIDEKSYLNNQSYWKMDNVFLLEICINLKEKISLGILEKFALSISDKWQVYGNPVNEILISNTMSGCNMKKSEVIMMNMFFESSEIF